MCVFYNIMAFSSAKSSFSVCFFVPTITVVERYCCCCCRDGMANVCGVASLLYYSHATTPRHSTDNSCFVIQIKSCATSRKTSGASRVICTYRYTSIPRRASLLLLLLYQRISRSLRAAAPSGCDLNCAVAS